ncbi:MAG: sigma-54 dependent transcriptional regulator [Cellvibrionaceae bacterium]|nr:sigma-54 dependent transcriptional regulator [Cellvibrionaceae bacterium]
MTQLKALIIDDEPDICELLELTLQRMDIDTQSAGSVADAQRLIEANQYHLCLTDMRLPDGNGIDLVKLMQAKHPDVPVAVITAHGNMDTAVEAMKAGAFDFVSKPVDLAALRKLVSAAVQSSRLPDSSSQPRSSRLIGNSKAIQNLEISIRKLARSQAPVYIAGESGSGKELVARSIHELGPRAHGPFIPVNCGAIPSELMESEFFGHKKGSFTGAHQDKQGLFQAAEGGTLFLDEVADLPLEMQVKLLRAIQEKAVRPVGASAEIKTDVRILSATHKDLAKEVDKGHFRQDLFYRLNVIQLSVPPLRERKEDLPLLAQHILRKLAQEVGVPMPEISADAMEQLRHYEFPGNVRELENILERAFTLCEGNVIKGRDLQLHVTPQPIAAPVKRPAEAGKTDHYARSKEYSSLDEYLAEIERDVILGALETVRWNKTVAARELGITFRSLRYRLQKLGLETD